MSRPIDQPDVDAHLARIAQEPILQFFRYQHLPERLAAISKPFGDMAHDLVAKLPRNAERTVALRKLLEAKDAAVRADLFIVPSSPT